MINKQIQKGCLKMCWITINYIIMYHLIPLYLYLRIYGWCSGSMVNGYFLYHEAISRCNQSNTYEEDIQTEMNITLNQTGFKDT